MGKLVWLQGAAEVPRFISDRVPYAVHEFREPPLEVEGVRGVAFMEPGILFVSWYGELYRCEQLVWGKTEETERKYLKSLGPMTRISGQKWVKNTRGMATIGTTLFILDNDRLWRVNKANEISHAAKDEKEEVWDMLSDSEIFAGANVVFSFGSDLFIVRRHSLFKIPNAVGKKRFKRDDKGD